MSLAMGSTFSSFTIFSDMTITKAAPSEVCDEFPAVTHPPWANTGFSLDNAFTLVPGRGPSSVSTIYFLTSLFSSEFK